MPLETEEAGDWSHRGLWTFSYSVLLAPVCLLSVIGIIFFDSPSTPGTRWVFSGDALAATNIGAAGLVIFGTGCTEALRHFRFSRNRDWIVWHFASCALLYLVVGLAAIMLARSGPERGRAYGVDRASRRCGGVGHFSECPSHGVCSGVQKGPNGNVKDFGLPGLVWV